MVSRSVFADPSVPSNPRVMLTPPCLQEMSPTTDINLVHSLMNLFDCFMDCYEDEKHLKVTPESDVRTHLEVGPGNATRTVAGREGGGWR